MYAEIKDPAILAQALQLARGCYQRDILLGREALSGATLRGVAKRYSGRYKASAQAVLHRCQAAGLPVRETVRKHGKRVLVVG